MPVEPPPRGPAGKIRGSCPHRGPSFVLPVNPSTLMNATTHIQPYLFFSGRCEEALAFYKTTLGAEIEMVMHFKDNPEPSPERPVPPGFENKVMHAGFRIGGSTLMASDGCGDPSPFNGFSLSLTLPTEDDCRRVFAALADGGKVTMPLGRTFWSPCFGMVTDRFGLGWMITLPG